MRISRRAAALAFLLAGLAGGYGCATVEEATKLGASFAQSQGMVTQEQAKSIVKTTSAVAKSFEDITPEQEYYIGRTVGAVIVNKYRVYPNTEANEYLNLLGQTLAQASDRPETFGGYHFLILDSGEINAFAAPGGLIFVSRGMLRNCKSEDAVAAVLAHEIGHVQLRHGLQSIDKSRLTQALTTLAAEGAKTFGKKELADLTRAFEGSITDITSTMINNGYSRAFEREADAAAVKILSRVGYDPNGLVAMLTEMEKHLKPGGLDFAKTHPSPKSRIEDIESLNVGGKSYREVSARQARFRTALGKI
ncbi:MAG TPA: M48 family metalloprotease [Candidatus Deferrimicrobiaceae bacterium]|jgi:predicted Zn-dependent protease